MIDTDWFNQIAALAEPCLENFDTRQLCDELGVQGEVLPFIVVSAGGFADWPLARQALRDAVRSVPRVAGFGSRPEGNLQSDHLRRDLRATIGAVLQDHCSGGSTESGGAFRWKAAEQIARYGSRGSGDSQNPASFIAVD